MREKGGIGEVITTLVLASHGDAEYSDRTFESNLVLANGSKDLFWHSDRSIWSLDRCHTHSFPAEGDLVHKSHAPCHTFTIIHTSPIPYTCAASSILTTAEEISGPIPSPSMRVTV